MWVKDNSFSVVFLPFYSPSKECELLMGHLEKKKALYSKRWGNIGEAHHHFPSKLPSALCDHQKGKEGLVGQSWSRIFVEERMA